jgi:hypothetical protein
MKERLLKLSDGTEILVVLLIAFRMFLPANLGGASLTRPAGAPRFTADLEQSPARVDPV